MNDDLEPYCPSCNTYAKDMSYLDDYASDYESRGDYIRQEEGTYNPINAHFLCDYCYIKVGMPATEYGWKCP